MSTVAIVLAILFAFAFSLMFGGAWSEAEAQSVINELRKDKES